MSLHTHSLLIAAGLGTLTQTVHSQFGFNGWRLGGNSGTNPAVHYVGTKDGADLILRTNNVPRLEIDGTTGNVGVGLPNPTARLDVGGTTRLRGVATVGTGQQLQSESAGGARILGEQGNTAARPAIGFFSFDGVNDGSGGNGIYRPLANAMAFATASTERMRISSGGNVGINNPNPVARLDVGGTTRLGGVASIAIGQQLQSESAGGARILGEQGNTAARPAIGFFSADGVNDGSGGNGIYRPAANAMAFATASTERMRITSGGAIGIGTASPATILSVVQGSATDPIADAWTVYSSRRWKTGIKTIENALDKVEQLRGVTYESTASGKPDVGFIAEEVGAVIPELVQWEENGKDAKSLDYARLTAFLVEAVKTQQTQIQAQADALQTQQRQIDELKKLAAGPTTGPARGN